MIFKPRYIIVYIIIFTTLVYNSSFAAGMEKVNFDYKAFILGSMDNENVLAYLDICDALSIKTQIISKEEVDSIEDQALIIVPNDYADDVNTNIKIKEKVKEGSSLLTDSASLLAKTFEIEFHSDTFSTKKVRYLNHEELLIKWGEEREFNVLKMKKAYKSLGYDEDSLNSIAVTFDYESGVVLFLSTNILDEKKKNYVIYPFLSEYLLDILNTDPVFKANRLAAYMDWGFYYDKEPYAVAKDLSNKGINEVHFSGWYAVNDYDIFTKKFIDACHKEGILIYCWLELPMVSKEFWDENIEFREKRTNLEDAHIDWRYLMALDNPDCRKAIFHYYKDFFDRYDFDGVDIAELYYEYPVEDVFLDPYHSEFAPLERWMVSYFTPMNDYFREQYKNKFGYDPYFLFKDDSDVFFKKNPDKYYQYINYREQLILELNRVFIEFFQNERAIGKALDVIVTQIDSIFDKKITEQTGVNSSKLLDLSKEMDFVLNIEDPFHLWKLGPSRYQDISENYVKNGANIEKINIDINIVDRRGFDIPTSKQTGLEFLQLLSQASKNSNQVFIYASHTPYEYDFRSAPYALASSTEVMDNIVKNRFNVLYLTDTLNYSYYVNDELWPIYNEEGIILLPGKNKITKEASNVKIHKLHIMNLSTEVEEVQYVDNGIKLYNNQASQKHLIITLNKIVKEIYLDGELYYPKKYLQNNKVYTVHINKPFKELFIREEIEENNYVTIVLNGSILEFKKNLYLINGRYFADFEELVNSVNGEYQIHNEFVHPTAFANHAEYALWAQVENEKALANGREVLLNEPPKIIDGDLYFPIRFFYNSFGYNVNWHQDDKIVMCVPR